MIDLRRENSENLLLRNFLDSFSIFVADTKKNALWFTINFQRISSISLSNIKNLFHFINHLFSSFTITDFLFCIASSMFTDCRDFFSKDIDVLQSESSSTFVTTSSFWRFIYILSDTVSLSSELFEWFLSNFFWIFLSMILQSARKDLASTMCCINSRKSR